MVSGVISSESGWSGLMATSRFWRMDCRDQEGVDGSSGQSTSSDGVLCVLEEYRDIRTRFALVPAMLDRLANCAYFEAVRNERKGFDVGNMVMVQVWS